MATPTRAETIVVSPVIDPPTAHDYRTNTLEDVADMVNTIAINEEWRGLPTVVSSGAGHHGGTASIDGENRDTPMTLYAPCKLAWYRFFLVVMSDILDQSARRSYCGVQPINDPPTRWISIPTRWKTLR
jgi:hypothetical protein